MWVATAIEKCNKNTTIECLAAIFVLVTNIVKHIAISQMLIAKKTKVATKLVKIVLFCTIFELNVVLVILRQK